MSGSRKDSKYIMWTENREWICSLIYIKQFQNLRFRGGQRVSASALTTLDSESYQPASLTIG